MSTYTLALHGGAGTISKTLMTPEKEKSYRDALALAASTGEEILKNGGSALDAVEASVRSLEDCPLFNAGKGAVFTNDGKNELDASIMRGDTLEAGAVGGVKNVKNPISLARAVMEKSEHVLMFGDGAAAFAKSVGAQFESDDYFFVQARYDQLLEAKKTDSVFLDHSGEANSPDNKTKFGTVGAVALDLHGNVAAATSTGGMTNKKFGRAGDSPIIGSGTYANNKTCAISCTGHGEFFIRAVVAYDISCLMEYRGMTLKDACNEVVKNKLVKFGGEGGLVAVDAAGNIELPFNSEGMYRAWVKKGTEVNTEIY